MESTKNPPDPRRRIRWMAVWMTAYVWIIGAAMAIYHGESATRALTISSIQAISGLLAWFCYHLIGRSNDGMAIFIMALVRSESSYDPSGPSSRDVMACMISGCVLILVCCLFGAFLRTSDKHGSGGGRAMPAGPG